MKKIFYLFYCLMAVFAFSACSDDDDAPAISEIQVQLQYPEGVQPAAGVKVIMKNASNGVAFDQLTNEQGIAKFAIPEGLYEASASEKRAAAGKVTVFNGVDSNINVDGISKSFNLKLEMSNGGSVLIKELYFGGCPKDDGSGRFAMDQYVILYNNSDVTIDLSNFAFAMVNPYNATGANKDIENGKLFYESQHKIPAGAAVWYFNDKVMLEGGKQIVVSMTGAIDHTQTYSKSVNLANSDYYCFYDLENFDNAKYYPAPFEGIATSHYLKSYKFGLGNAWPLSQMSPAFFVFNPEGTTLKAFVDDPATTHNYGGNEKMGRKMVPESWIVDAVEVFQEGKDNTKRLTSAVDAGYIYFTNGLGYSVYRNVDKAATEAIAGNKEKLVMGSDDPSGIDAEASIKNGARIIYMDTNNSTNDMHVRKVQSIK